MGDDSPHDLPDRCGGGERVAFFQIAEPGLLAFGKLPGPGLDQIAGLFQRGDPSRQKVEQFAIAEGLSSGSTQRWLPIAELFDLVQPAGREHRFNPGIDPLVQPVPRGLEPVHLSGPFVEWKRMLLPQPGGWRSGEVVDLQGPDDPAQVLWGQFCCGRRINLGQLCMERVRAPFSGLGFELLAELPVGRWPLEHAPQQRAEIQPGPSHKQGDPAALEHIADRSFSCLQVLRRGKLFVRIDEVQQVMGNSGLFRSGWLGCADIQFAIDRHGIETENFSANLFRQSEREF